MPRAQGRWEEGAYDMLLCACWRSLTIIWVQCEPSRLPVFIQEQLTAHLNKAQ